MMSDKQIDNAEELKDYIEDRIRKYTFHAKNFSKEDMDFVDTFCKDCYDNNRKLMVLDSKLRGSMLLLVTFPNLKYPLSKKPSLASLIQDSATFFGLNI